MQSFAGGHSGKEGHRRLCPHLVGADADDAMYVRVLRGKGVEADLCCRECGESIKNGESIEWSSVCETCIEAFDEADYNLIEWVGQAEIKEHPTSFNAGLKEVVLPDDVTSAVALAPLDDSRFVGFGDEMLFLVNQECVVPICPVSLPPERNNSSVGYKIEPRLHISPDGRFAAVCHDYGRYGLVVDLQEKRVTMNLDKGSYRNEHTPFPAAFFPHDNQTFLIHATNWNRADISDPSDGTLLSVREFEPAAAGERQPEHYSGFWHGQLHVSPDSQWVADDQWCWGPAGEVRTWNLVQWLEQNVWESEDGSSCNRLCQRIYLWNIPVAWVDAEHVAIWGIGYDDQAMLSGARIFKVLNGEETATFAGPSHTAFFGGDGRLFSAEEDGLHIWDSQIGARLGRIDGFKPKWQRGDFLIELNGTKVRAWNWRTSFD